MGDELLVAHVDVDAFYVAVERADDPSLAGVPLAVQQGNSGGFVAVSAEARAAGVRKGDGVGAGGRAVIQALREMGAVSAAEARRRCPGLVVRPSTFVGSRVHTATPVGSGSGLGLVVPSVWMRIVWTIRHNSPTSRVRGCHARRRNRWVGLHVGVPPPARPSLAWLTGLWFWHRLRWHIPRMAMLRFSDMCRDSASCAA